MIGDRDLAVASKVLDLAALRQKLIAHNIANADVKSFHRLSADFSEEFMRAIAKGDLEGAQKTHAVVTKSKEAGVDSDAEIAALAKNEGMFTTFSEIAAFRMRMLRTAITSK